MSDLRLKMILDWFDAREILVFADQIFLEIEKAFPIQPSLGWAAKIGKEKRKLDRMVMKTRAFALQNHPNIYKKARFLNALKWKLRESGYDETFSKDVVALLTTAMSL